MPDWQERARCAGDLTFTERPYVQQARVCAGCPVRIECLEFGVAHATGKADTTCYGGLPPEKLARIARARTGAGRQLSLKRCAHCLGEFWGSRAQLYCARVCRQRAYEARRPGRVTA